MISSNSSILHVGDIVEHDAHREGDPGAQGKGLLTRLVKKSADADRNLWEVRFFAGTTFEILEEYLKKIQGALDFAKRS
jgi:hypothetical protein